MNDTTENRKKFATIMLCLAEECGGKLSKGNLKVRFNALSEYSIEQVSRACDWLFKHREATFPAVPRTKEIIDVIKSQSGEIEAKTQAQIQVDIVLKYLNYYGSACYHTFKDPITDYLMTNRWSFQKLGLMKAEDLKWFRMDFCEAYQDMTLDVVLVDNIIGVMGGPPVPVENLKKLLK